MSVDRFNQKETKSVSAKTQLKLDTSWRSTFVILYVEECKFYGQSTMEW